MASPLPCRRPVFLTLCHMMACATLGYLLSLGKCTPIKPLRTKKQMSKVCLLASIFCLTIVLGNLSLKYIPVSFNQAIGATTPFFTAIFALLMQGEHLGATAVAAAAAALCRHSRHRPERVRAQS